MTRWGPQEVKISKVLQDLLPTCCRISPTRLMEKHPKHPKAVHRLRLSHPKPPRLEEEMPVSIPQSCLDGIWNCHDRCLLRINVSEFWVIKIIIDMELFE